MSEKLARDENTGDIMGVVVTETKAFEAFYINLEFTEDGPVGIFDEAKGLKQKGIWLNGGNETHVPLRSFVRAFWVEISCKEANEWLLRMHD